MLRVLRRPDQLQHLSVLGRSLTCSPVALGEHARCEKTDVPAGHQNSDLRKQVCHIGLNRRRDLSLREDLCLFQPGGKATVRDIFKVVSSHSSLQLNALHVLSLSNHNLGCCRARWLVSLVFQIWDQPAQTSTYQTSWTM